MTATGRLRHACVAKPHRPAGARPPRLTWTRIAIAVAALAWLPVLAAAEPAWHPIGSARGVEAFSAHTDGDVVRIGFRNARDRTVRIEIKEAVIWCGGGRPGEGRAVPTAIGGFVLEPGGSRWDPDWSRPCAASRYFVEFGRLTIAFPEPEGEATRD